MSRIAADTPRLGEQPTILPVAPAPWWSSPAVLLRLAMLLTAAAYARTVTFDFVFDDHLQIALNPWVQAWRFVPHYFTGHVWSFEQPAWAGNYYRPLFLLWLRVVHSMVGLTPGWWHLLSIAAHLLATWLVYRLGVRLTRSSVAAGLAALLFGVNPIHIEAVAWVSGIPETLLAIFCMASFLAYLNWRESGPRRRWWMAASLAAYALAMLVKETGVVLAAIILAHALLFGAPRALGRVKSVVWLVLPYVLVSLAYFLARWNVLRGVVSPLHHRPLETVVMTWPTLLLWYLRLLLWPFGLSAYYDQELVKAFSLREVLLPALIVAVVVAGFIPLSRRSRLMLLGGIAILLPILPAVAGSAVFQMGDFVHDRYLYLPSVAFSLMLGGAFISRKVVRGQRPVAGADNTDPRPLTTGHFLRVGLAIVVALVLAVATAMQTAPWDNDLALFSHARRKAPHNVRAIEGLAEAHGMLGDMEGAIRVQREAVVERPDYWAGLCNLGMYLYRAERYPEAEQTLLRAIDNWPKGIKPLSANQFYFLGMSRLQMGRMGEAEAPLRRAVELRPDAAGYHYALGTVLKQQGRVEEAAVEFRAEAENRKRIDEWMKALVN